MTEDWRIGTTAEDYFRAQQKRVAIEQRRPVIRKASDLVGPGIGSEAVVVTDYNDPLATFNGYFSSAPGALYAPNSTDPFIGSTFMDATLGGVQSLTSLVTSIEYTRAFVRNPSDESSISFSVWRSPEIVPATAFSKRIGGAVGTTESDSGVTVACNLPTLDFIGDPSTYARSTTVLTIKRPGVYSGRLRWQMQENIYVNAVSVEYPNGDAQTFDAYYSVLGPTGLDIPLHFVTTTDVGFLRVNVFQDFADNQHALFQRLHVSRIGDAD